MTALDPMAPTLERATEATEAPTTGQAGRQAAEFARRALNRTAPAVPVALLAIVFALAGQAVVAIGLVALLAAMATRPGNRRQRTVPGPMAAILMVLATALALALGEAIDWFQSSGPSFTLVLGALCLLASWRFGTGRGGPTPAHKATAGLLVLVGLLPLLGMHLSTTLATCLLAVAAATLAQLLQPLPARRALADDVD